mgnify:CR=1 FL=1
MWCAGGELGGQFGIGEKRLPIAALLGPDQGLRIDTPFKYPLLHLFSRDGPVFLLVCSDDFIHDVCCAPGRENGQERGRLVIN